MGSSNKRFYYFQMWEGFFKNRIIKKMSKLPSGDSIIVCYQRLIIATLNSTGWLYYEGLENTLIEEIALEIDMNEEIVKLTIAALVNYGLAIPKDDNSAIQILIIDDVMRIGSEGQSAGRMREKRAQKRMELAENPPDSAQCAHIVQKCAIEIDKDIQIDVEIDEVLSIIQLYNDIFPNKYKVNSDNRGIIGQALRRITYVQACNIVENEHKRYLNKEYDKFYPNIGWMFGQGLDECLARIEKPKNQFNRFMRQHYDMESLEKELICN